MLYYIIHKREDRVKHYGLEHVKMNESTKSCIRTYNWPTSEELLARIKEQFPDLPLKKIVRKLVYIPEEIRGDEEARDEYTSNLH
jgi:2-oxoglutarate dehydrogenase complex dehydrogenase (E1) component-like enzyme